MRKFRSTASVSCTFPFTDEEHEAPHPLADFDGYFHIEGDVEPFVPAKISGPPEDCYPAEGGHVEITKVEFRHQKGSGTPYLQDMHKYDEIVAAFKALIESNERLRESIKESLSEAAQEDTRD